MNDLESKESPSMNRLNVIISRNGDTIITTQTLSKLEKKPFITSDDVIDNEIEKPLFPKKKNLKERWFAKMGYGSLRGSTFTMLATALGAGMFAIPMMCQKIGVVSGILMLLIGGIIAWAAMKMMDITAKTMGVFSFSLLIKETLGKKIAKVFEVIIFFYLFGAIISYQIIISRFFGQLIEQIFGVSWSGTIRAIEILAQTTIIWPIAIIKDLSGLRYFSLAGIGIIFYIFFAVIIETPIFMLSSGYSNLQIELFDGGIFDYITGFAISAFAYQSHTSFFPMRVELNRPASYRINKIINRSVSLEFLIYEILMLGGYLSTPGAVTPLIIERNLLDGGMDYPMVVAKAGLMITLSIAIPINLHPTRENFFLLIGKEGEQSNKARILVTTGIIYFAAIIAILLPDIYSAIAIIGGFCGVAVMITFPFLIYTVSQGFEGSKKFALHSLNAIISAVGIAAGIISLLNVCGIEL